MNVLDPYNACEYNSESGVIECKGDDEADIFWIVSESGNPWAYGVWNDSEMFCCSAAEMDDDDHDVKVWVYDADDTVCLHDQDNPYSDCYSNAAGIQVWPSTQTVTVYGGDHNDDIDTAGGDDIVWAGSGDDYVTTFDGDDIVYGGEDDDIIDLGDGDDVGFGEGGRDFIYGRDGVDEVCGGDAADYLWGGAAGYDCVCGGIGGVGGNNDTAADYLFGLGGGNDDCFGDSGDTYDTTTCEDYGDQDCACGCNL